MLTTPTTATLPEIQEKNFLPIAIGIPKYSEMTDLRRSAKKLSLSLNLRKSHGSILARAPEKTFTFTKCREKSGSPPRQWEIKKMQEILLYNKLI